MTSGLYWLSFADPARPTGQQFLGVAIVRARLPLEAVKVSHALGINPGGEVQMMPVVYEPGILPIPDEYLERLLDRATIEELLVKVGGA